MSSTDYTGRTVDLFIAQGAEERGSREITTGFALDGGGQVTTGVQKAAQFFLIVFLTERTTRAHDQSFGTRFVTQLRQTNANSPKVRIAFQEAADDVLEQQQKYKSASAADDEIIGKIELLDFNSPQADTVELRIRITTLAGTSREVIVPVSLAIE